MTAHRSIDWERLARDVGAIRAGGESGGSDLARRALEEVVGLQEWRSAVDYYVSSGPGAELARSVLWLVHPWAAMERCHELFRTSENPEIRRDAVELLRVVADRRVLPWVRGYLEDGDAGVQQWGAGVVDQLLWSHLVEPQECAELLEEMSRHPNPGVQKTVGWIRSFLKERESSAEPAAAADRGRS